MTIEDVDWLLRYPSDELVMSQETLNQIEAAISGVGTRFTQHKIQRVGVREEPSGRLAMVPKTLADRKLTIDPSHRNCIDVRVKGEQKIAIYFKES